MLSEVTVPQKGLSDFAPIVGDDVVRELKSLAGKLAGSRVLHINSTSYGGGVAEILYTLVPLMRDVGLDAHWKVISGEPEFFTVTKAFHNALQGMPLSLDEKARETYLRICRLNAEHFSGEWDFVVIHDSQPAGMIRYLSKGGARWVWRCHIDLTTANDTYWQFLDPIVEQFDAAIFTLPQFVPRDLRLGLVKTMPPCIDPMTVKNDAVSRDEAVRIVEGFGLDSKRPILLQVSRFDPWKDPLGVVDAYRIVKKKRPEVQLVLLGSMASDDPEGWDYFERTARHVGEDRDVHLLHNVKGCGNLEVNAFQVLAEVVIQKSTREGFGLVVAEALWKGKPVVAGKAGGIPLQVLDGRTGFLVEGVAPCAERILYLLEHPKEKEEMGRAGRKHVLENFLCTRNLKDYLEIFTQLREQTAAVRNR
ncbi:MAG: glycosyltransferase [Armatimonadetes bacterium]|nr:glycosyltransferase [Armatimonadota bacterium]